MTDTKDTDNTGRRPLTLKRADSGTVKQSFSHGRSKAVVVEKTLEAIEYCSSGMLLEL